MLLETREDIKYSPRALILLIGLQLVDMKQLDDFLSKVCDINEAALIIIHKKIYCTMYRKLKVVD